MRGRPGGGGGARPRRATPGADGGLLPRAVRDGRGARRDAGRGPRADPAERRQRLREGGAQDRGLGHRGGRRRPVAGGRADRDGRRRARGGRRVGRRLPARGGLLVGREPSEEAFAAAGRIAAEDCDPVTDTRGTAAYKRHLAGELTERALRRAAERARRS
ncbi:hypothetical protein ACFQ0M_39635 [Kitasatospora aburaviensis]